MAGWPPTFATLMHPNQKSTPKRHASVLRLLLLLPLLAPPGARAAELLPEEPLSVDGFGFGIVQINSNPPRVSVRGNIGIVGAPANANTPAYLYRNLDTAAGTVTETARLTASNASGLVRFGFGVSLSGATALVGAPDDGSVPGPFLGTAGAAYLFRNLDTATGTVIQDLKLRASDAANGDRFGISVSLSDSLGIIGAIGDDSFRGSAYLFRNLDTVTGQVTENAKLAASDGVAFDAFGESISLSGTTALVGAPRDDDQGGESGAAYLFRSLDTATGLVNESAKLLPSNGRANAGFGESVSIDGNMALVGAETHDEFPDRGVGRVYLFRDLDTASGTVTEKAILTGFNPTNESGLHVRFGKSVSLSGTDGMVGGNDHAYLFRNLDTAAGVVTETVRFTRSDPGTSGVLNGDVSLNGDLFLVNDTRGSVLTGSVSSVTTLDAGDASRLIEGLSFLSFTDWIIGQTTDNNQVILSEGDSASVTAAGKAVFIGQNSGSDDNTLVIGGFLTAGEVWIGSAGNEGNILQFDDTADFTIGSIYLAPENVLSIEGDYTGIAALLAYLDDTELQVWDDGLWQTVTALNHADLITASFLDGYTAITATAIPEPPTVALLGLLPCGCALLARRRRSRIRRRI